MAALPDSLRAMGADLLALVYARVELAAVELQEERARAERKLALLALAALSLAIAMLLGSLLVVVLFWDTHRALAAGGVSLLHLGAGGWALLRLREMKQASQNPFSATLGEFAHDLAALRGRSE
jgi:uncharacterized membrane protein YqjE